MHLTILAVPGCPNAVLLEERVTSVLADHGHVTVSRHLITTAEEATRWGMHGSPTILVNGTDPFGGPGQAASMSCPAIPGHQRPDNRRAVNRPASPGHRASSRSITRPPGAPAKPGAQAHTADTGRTMAVQQSARAVCNLPIEGCRPRFPPGRPARTSRSPCPARAAPRPGRDERRHGGNRNIPVDVVLGGLRLGHPRSPWSGSACRHAVYCEPVVVPVAIPPGHPTSAGAGVLGDGADHGVEADRSPSWAAICSEIWWVPPATRERQSAALLTRAGLAHPPAVASWSDGTQKSLPP